MTILIVDDNPSITKPLLSLLSHFGHSCCACSTPDAVLKAVADFKPDLIFLDIMLGDDADGLQVLGWIRKAGFAGKIAMYTALSDPAYVSRAKADGADFYVVKNGEMLAAVQGVINQTQSHVSHPK